MVAELTGTRMCAVSENDESRQNDGSETVDPKEINGGADGARTRDLQRDRLAF